MVAGVAMEVAEASSGEGMRRSIMTTGPRWCTYAITKKKGPHQVRDRMAEAGSIFLVLSRCDQNAGPAFVMSRERQTRPVPTPRPLPPPHTNVQ